jgi:hypothetical protein
MFKRREYKKSIQKSKPRYGCLKPDNKPDKKCVKLQISSFCLTFMNSMEDNRENQRPRPWIFKSQGARPSTFDVCEYQICMTYLKS